MANDGDGGANECLYRCVLKGEVVEAIIGAILEDVLSRSGDHEYLHS